MAASRPVSDGPVSCSSSTRMTHIAYATLQAPQDASVMDSRVSVAWACLLTIFLSTVHASVLSALPAYK